MVKQSLPSLPIVKAIRNNQPLLGDRYEVLQNHKERKVDSYNDCARRWANDMGHSDITEYLESLP